jgi:hypothetical protein
VLSKDRYGKDRDVESKNAPQEKLEQPPASIIEFRRGTKSLHAN